MTLFSPSSRLPAFLLVAAYGIGFLIYGTLLLRWGAGYHCPPSHLLLGVAAWMGLTAAWTRLLLPIRGWGTPVRRMIWEEEQHLLPLFQEALAQLPSARIYRLRIVESGECDAFALASRVVAVSKPLVALLTPAELQAVIAHELGHLTKGDSWVLGWMNAFIAPSGWLAWGGGKLLQGLQRLLRRRGGRPLLTLLLGILLWERGAWATLHGLLTLGLLLLFPILNGYAQLVFSYGIRYSIRQREYRADQFAQSLGRGAALRTALLKLIDRP